MTGQQSVPSKQSIPIEVAKEVEYRVFMQCQKEALAGNAEAQRIIREALGN